MFATNEIWRDTSRACHRASSSELAARGFAGPAKPQAAFLLLHHAFLLRVPEDLLPTPVRHVRQMRRGDDAVAQFDRGVRLLAALAAFEPVLHVSGAGVPR